MTYLRTAFPDLVFTPLIYAAEGERIAVRWRINGTHEGEFLGAPATHRRIEDFGVDIFTFYGGMIRTINVNENYFNLMRQLGLIEPGKTWRKMMSGSGGSQQGN